MNWSILRITLYGFILFSLAACSESLELEDESSRLLFDSYISATAEATSPSGSSSSNAANIPPGQMTAGEWNDLEEWDYLKVLLEGEHYGEMEEHWSYNTSKRYAVELKTILDKPVIDCKIELKDQSGAIIWTAKTDNKGRAELWEGLYGGMSLGGLTISGAFQGMPFSMSSPKPFHLGVNTIVLGLFNAEIVPTADIAFVVDATGSMGDEIEYLKVELNDVIATVKANNPDLTINTGSVFYRDIGDEYVTRIEAFSTSVGETVSFINDQNARGGGDYPEAVDAALRDALTLDWSDKALTRILFLVLDAPPHYNDEVIADIQESIKVAAEAGIKVIPVTASGIEKTTEFLMRFFAMSTNGTYVFITDHSGIGNDHLEPSIGEYEVEFLNELMIRLIKEYTAL